MLNTIIIDDEKNGAESLELLIREYCPEINIVAKETSPFRAIGLINASSPQLLFLDIEMPGMNGFELLNELNSFVPSVIFTTAYKQYAVQAFRCNALDYLLKPVMVSELITAVERAKERIKSKERKTERLHLEKSMDEAGYSVIMISSQHEIVAVNTKQIIRLVADSNYTHILLTDGRKITSAKTLKEYEEILNPDVFFRVHKKFLINIYQVEKYVRGENSFLMMKDKFRVDISRRKKTEFLLYYKHVQR